MRLLPLILLFALTASCNKQETVTIGHQLMANPWKWLIAQGGLKQLDGKKVEFRKFNSGAKVINAMASGSIDIAVVGSTPAAAGMSQGLPLKLVGLMEIIGDAEAMVVRNEINTLEDLKGKKVGVPFGSTTHYHLMMALEMANIKADQVSILNLTPPAIVSAWKKGEIDAGFVWSPALEDLKKMGKVLLSSKDMASKGKPTFDGIVVHQKFLKSNRKAVKELLKKIDQLHSDYNTQPWDEKNEKIQAIAQFVGSTPSQVSQTLKGYTFPQAKTQNLQQIGQSLKDTAEFLKGQGKIEKTLESYQTVIDSTLIQEI